MGANYKLWPLAHLVNFAFIPSSQRILYTNVIAVSLHCPQAHSTCWSSVSTDGICKQSAQCELARKGSCMSWAAS